MKLHEILDLSLSQVEILYETGRISRSIWKRYCFFWVWGAARFSHELNAARKQEKAFQKLGKELYRRRREKVTRWANQVMQEKL